jgi:plasmid stabilization system protein ParE
MDVLLRDSVFAAKDNPRAARDVVRRIDTIERLGEFPGLGHRGKVPGTREWVVRGLPYIIVYEVDPDLDELTVLAVFHGARDR